MGRLVGRNTPITMTTEQVGTDGLDAADQLEMAGGYRLDRRWNGLVRGEVRRDPENGLIWPKTTHRLEPLKSATALAVEEE